MKQIIIIFLTGATLSSCLKQSIADAMLASINAHNNYGIMSYTVNGDAVKISGSNNPISISDSFVECFKSTDINGNINYTLHASNSNDDFVFSIYTDSLTAGNYSYDSIAVGVPIYVLT